MSPSAENRPNPSPSRETLAHAASMMRLVRELAAMPAVGSHRVRRLLVEVRDRFNATAAAARIEWADGREGRDLLTLDWGAGADHARERHRRGAGTGQLLVDLVPIDAGRSASLSLFRAAGPAFDEADASWLRATHAGCVWAYAGDAGPATLTSRSIERLAPRDRETLDGLLSGASEKQIAARIGRSPHTVHTRVKRIYRQLGVTSRSELLARCLGGTPPPRDD